MRRKLPPKCKAGKVCVMHVTKGGKQKVKFCKGVTHRGKKRITFQKKQRKNKKHNPLAALAIS